MVESVDMRLMRHDVATGLVMAVYDIINQVETVAYAEQGGEGIPYDAECCKREED